MGFPLFQSPRDPPPSGPPRWNFENLKKTVGDMVPKSKHRKFHPNRSIRKYLNLGGGMALERRKKEKKKERTQ